MKSRKAKAMHDLNLAMIQTALHWENPAANLEMFTGKLNALHQPCDLIVLPEMFSTGFSMRTELAENMNGPSLNWMRDMAESKGCVITGSLMIREGKHCYNRLIWMQADGRFETYDKRHLFRMMQEHKHYTAGNKRLIVQLHQWRICPLICYDMRFPVWSRNRNEYDLLLYLANWPEIRSRAWKDLIRGRAHENQCYAAGLNRVGKDGRGIPFSGDSTVVSPKGETLWQATPGKEETKHITLSWETLQDFRNKFPQHLDADDFIITN